MRSWGCALPFGVLSANFAHVYPSLTEPLDISAQVGYNWGRAELYEDQPEVSPMIAEQLPLFPQKNLKGEYGPPLSSAKGPLTRNSSLGAAMVGFRDYMVLSLIHI